jgi:crossover junction endodeoxyribonuclease RusA
MTITLPLPPAELAPNWRSRSHWPKTRAIAEYRNTAKVCALFALGPRYRMPRWKLATVQATFYFRDARRRDGDNLAASLKSAWDGLVDAGIIEDDSGLTHAPVVVGVDRRSPRVELWVEGAP